MGLLSFLKRQDATPPATGAAADQSLVASARTSARRRLIGAMVLLGAGVVAFPLIFETQPRPIPVDIPIEIPRKEGLPPLAVPAPRPAAAASQAMITETRAEAPRDVVPAGTAASEPAATPPSPVKPEPKAPPPTEARPPPKAEPAAAPRVAAAPEPKAESKPTASATEGGRFVVQVGAFAESSAVRDVRAKVEKLGLSTYTQVVETAGGARTRVRVGPFAKREDADKVAARLKAAGLPGAVLTL